MSKVTHLTLDEGGGLNRRRIHLREISGDADAPLETVGQDLRAARLRRGDDLATVSKALKIRKDHLEALEEDRLEALPGRTYAIGFIRSYADYLGLDPILSVDRFKREIAGRGEVPQPAVFSEEHDERRLPHGWLVIAVVVLGLVVYGAVRLARSADTLLTEPVAPVPANLAAHAGDSAKAQPRHAPTVSKIPEPTAQTGTTPPPAPLPGNVTGANTVQTPAVANPDGLLGSGPGVLSGPPQSVSPANGQTASLTPPPPVPQGHVYGAQNGDARVILHAIRPARVLVEASDGTVFINRTLAAGDSYRVPDRVGVTLTTPDGGAVEFELDGQPMGAAGRPRQMTEAISLDPQAIVDHYNRASVR